MRPLEEVMNYLLFSRTAIKGIQVTILLATVFLNLGYGPISTVYAAPPSNDNFAAATVIGSIPFTDTVSTIEATQENNEPTVPVACDGRNLDNGVKTVWYRYTPGVSGLVYADTFGSDYDNYIAVWRGTTLNNLVFVACDDESEFDEAQISFNVQAGQSYYLQVAGYNGTVQFPDQGNLGGTLNFRVTFPNINVSIGGSLTARYYVPGGTGWRASYAGKNDGPVELVNVDGLPTIAAERVIYNVNGTPTSFSEMMGLPASQLHTTYWMPWYNNVDLDSQLRFGNVSASPATINVTIGGVPMPGSPFTLDVGESTRVSFPGVNGGPVKVESNVNIVAAERVIYYVNGVATSFSEMMGLPNSQLTTTYWMPWYNNVDLDTQLRFGNVSATQATVNVYIAGVPMTGSPFILPAGQSTRVSFPAINNGPVQIVSDVPIVASERVIYNINGGPVSFSEMMGLSDIQLGIMYWMPWYNNVDLDTQLRFGNVSGLPATVNVYIGGVLRTGIPIILQPGQSTRISFPGVNRGPVQIVSDVPIVAAERIIYKVNNIPTSFSEMMGLRNGLLDTRYWMPWYNNVDLDTQLRFGMP